MNIDSIVKNNFCTGCGVCISEDDNHEAKMIWNKDGFLVPKLGINSTQDKMIKVCPFYKNQKNEDELGEILFKNELTKHDEKLGYYLNFYAGFSEEFRETSSSGGIATYVFKTLLEKKIVDNLFIVKEKNGKYAYQLYSNIQEITKISKTRYTPVTLENFFEEISKVKGTVAVSGVACFVKAIRLKQYYYPEYKQKIPFIVGIICGGLKSKYYTDFLAQSAGCFDEYAFAEYRVKNEKSYALDYKFSCENKTSKKIHMVEMKTLGDMWGTGLFKSNACDFCDDVVTELADISLGDAWISPYDKSGLGNSIIITRTLKANKIIKDGIENTDLILDELSRDVVLKSQQGSFNHRHNGLKYRIQLAKKYTDSIPDKRSRLLTNQNILLKKVQILRSSIREKSLIEWQETNNLEMFNKNMSKIISTLRMYSALNRRLNRLIFMLKLWTKSK
ncbi:Coenzyme F420 hydrogenase/dehydrogenase, beta subunit C-terminal domain [Acinetobacter sp.]|uniref:Coenzyme F420 hydrogenase/dehydrogenase, beta subunit C-terminal domain n=1 Tax=Acinetobacter sp. TaxID=472 RepID=UPI003C72D311